MGLDLRRHPALAPAGPSVLRGGASASCPPGCSSSCGCAASLAVGGGGGRCVLGALNHGLFFALLYVGAYRLPSGLGSTLTALSPLVVMGVALVVLGERQARVTVVAAVVGVGGVLALVWQTGRGGVVDPVGVAAVVGAVVSSSVGFVLVKRWAPPTDVLTTTSWQLVAGGLLLVPLAWFTEGAPPPLDLPAVAALVYLGLAGTALGYVLWFRGLTRMDAGAVAVVGLVNPVVGTALGVALLGEPFGVVHLGAAALTLGSVLLAQAPVRRALRRRAASVLHRGRTPRGAAPVPTVGACQP